MGRCAPFRKTTVVVAGGAESWSGRCSPGQGFEALRSLSACQGDRGPGNGGGAVQPLQRADTRSAPTMAGRRERVWGR